VAASFKCGSSKVTQIFQALLDNLYFGLVELAGVVLCKFLQEKTEQSLKALEPAGELFLGRRA
jgi:mannose/fructose/N-acetylgalactosamine-specific phosphotransferase system component IID